MSLVQRDKECIWHPFTHHSLEGPPIALSAAKGAYLIGEDGTQYLDAISSWWVNLHGHGEPTIAEAISKQAKNLEHAIFAGFTHEPAIELAEKVLSILPENQSKIFYSDNGSTAVEVAIKMAIQHRENLEDKSTSGGGLKRRKLICLEGSYHGDTFGAMSVSARDSFTAPFADYLFDVHVLPSPTKDNGEQAIEALKTLLKSDKAPPVAFIYEPLVQGSGGMIMHDTEILSEILTICTENEIITIADEVMTGFGRTGSLFASSQLNPLPSIICLSKGITGGFLPLGATSCSEEIFHSFKSNDRRKFFFHGHSYTGNPLACASGIASFDLLMNESTKKQMELISSLHKQAAVEFEKSEGLKNIRQYGTVLALDFTSTHKSEYLNPLRDKLYNFFIERNILIRPLGNVVYLLPPYCITEKELSTCYQAILEAVDFISS